MNRLSKVTIRYSLFVAATALAAETQSADWPEWRGANRDNISHETGLLQEWPEEGPPLKWQVEGLGAGIDSVSISDGRICTFSFRDDVEYLTALDQRSGLPLWESPLGEALEIANPLMRWLSQRAPTIDGDRVYAVSTAGDLVCLRLDDGAELWRRSYSADFGAERPIFGYCDCPLVDGDSVIGTPCGSEATIVSLQRETGDIIWQTSIADVGPGYSGTVSSDASGVRQYVVHLSGAVVSLAADDGRLLWRHDETAIRLSNTLTPIALGDRILTFPYSGQGALTQLKVIREQERFRVEEDARFGARVDSFQDCPVLLGEHLFSFESTGIASCYRLGDETPCWRVRIPPVPAGDGAPETAQRRFGRSGVTFADGRLYVRGADDVLRLVEATPEEYREHGLFVLAEPTRDVGATLPVIAGGCLYIRDETRLFCYELRADASSTPPPAAVTVIIGNMEPASPPVSRGNWSQWRGPHRDNISHEIDLLQEWPEEGPPLEWRVEGVGEGIASVSLADGRIYTVGQIAGTEYVTALDERTGERLWAAATGPTVGAVHNNRLMRWLSQRTPTLDGDRVYVVRADGQVICFSADSGEEQWRKDFIEELGTRRQGWGFCDYPLVDGDHLICTPGSPEATIVALDKLTGEVRWRSALGDRRGHGYAALVAAEVDGLRQYVAFLGNALVGVAAEDGRLLWEYDGTANGTANSYTPLVLGEHILSANGYGTGVALLKLRRDNGAVRAEQVYFNSESFDAFQDCTVVDGDLLFCTLNNGILSCLDWTTGERLWATREIGSGKLALTKADGRLYLLTGRGNVALVEPDPEGCLIQGAFLLPDHEQSIGATFPVVAGGRLYLRNEDRLFCYDVRRDRGSDVANAPRTIALLPPADSESNSDSPRRVPRPIFVPTPQDVVTRMLELADVDKDDVVADLGSGDGRIVIAAAKTYGCRAIGYEIDEELVQVSRERVQREELGKLVTIEKQDMFTADLSDVDVVAVYVYSSVLEKLKSQFADLEPGARIVSHFFEIPGVEPVRVVEVESEETGNTHRILLYEAPLADAGTESPGETR